MGQPENEQKVEDISDSNILAQEIDSWSNFEYALREKK